MIPANHVTKLLAIDLRRAATHEAGHAVVALEHERSAQIIIELDTTIQPESTSNRIVGQCVRGLRGRRRPGKVENAAYGLAGFCAVLVFGEACGDFDASPASIAFWVAEARGQIDEDQGISDSDRQMWQGLGPAALTKSLKLAFTVVLRRHAEISEIVAFAEAQFRVRGYAMFNWPLDQFDRDLAPPMPVSTDR